MKLMMSVTNATMILTTKHMHTHMHAHTHAHTHANTRKHTCKHTNTQTHSDVRNGHILEDGNVMLIHQTLLVISVDP